MDIRELERILKEHLVARIGVADLAPFKEEGKAIPKDLLDPYTHALSMAIALDNEIIDGITDRPTNDYAHLYWKVNDLLNRAAFAASMWIEKQGYKAKAMPASYFAHEPSLMGNISHKAIARMAGIGWQGKSLLLITPEHGPRVRLVSVLTDMPLAPDAPIENSCGECMECTEACPVGAIRGVSSDPTTNRYENREQALDLQACFERTKENKAVPEYGALVCGVCIKVCPWGQKRKKKT
ncbi:MAG: epoxyqueuosine reductase [Thermodesulfovibrionales bacterium]|nr:epoxyqueuosine reductase [Thermodesulfovibrionales bacterium]